MDKETCKKLFQKYLELESKIRSSAPVVTPSRPPKILYEGRHEASNIDELNKLKNELGECLEFLSNDELFKIRAEEVLGPRVREILKERRIDGLL